MTIDPQQLGSLAIYALRYCVGRRSAAVSEVIEIVSAHWDEIDDKCKVIIKRDLEDAIASRDLGDDCDVAQWKLFKSWIDGEVPKPKHPETIKWNLGLAQALDSNDAS